MALFTPPDFDWIYKHMLIPTLYIGWCVISYSFTKIYLGTKFNIHGLTSGLLPMPDKRKLRIIKVRLAFYVLAATIIVVISGNHHNVTNHLLINFFLSYIFSYYAITKYFEDAIEKKYLYQSDSSKQQEELLFGISKIVDRDYT